MDNLKDIFLYINRLIYEKYITSNLTNILDLLTQVVPFEIERITTIKERFAKRLEEVKVELSSQLNKNKIETLFLISKEEYFQLIERYQTVVDSYKLSMHPYYLNLTLNELKMEDIFKVFKLLNVFAERYKEAIYKDFNEDYDAWHKYLSPIIPIKYFIQFFHP